MFSKYEMNLDVSNSHVNDKGEMKELAIVNSLQDIEGLHIDNLNEFTDYLNENNLGVFLLYRQIDIIRKPLFGQKLKLSTYPYNTNSISGYRHIYIHDDNNDDLLVTTNSFGAFVDLKTYFPARIPRSIIKTIKDGEESQLMEILPRKIEFNEESLSLLDSFPIKRSNIDRYKHVNNAFYIEFALDSFKEEFNYNRIRAEYKKSFKLGDTVKVYLNLDEKGHKIVILKDQNEEINAIIEFLDVKLDLL